MAPPTITFLAPPGLAPGSSVQLHDGTLATVGSGGLLSVSSIYINELESAGFVALVAAAGKYTANALSGAGTASAGDLTGAALVYALYSAVGAATLTTRTAAQMIADAALAIGQTYLCRIINSSGATTTLGAGTGVTITGTATMATNTWRDFLVTVTGAAAMTFQEVGTGTNS